MAKVNTLSQVLSLHAVIWALLYFSLSLSVFYFTSLHSFFLIHASYLFPLSPLSSATGLLAVCHHLKEHQVPLSGKAAHSKTQGHGDRPNTLSLSHTHISVHVHARLRLDPT